MFVPQHWAPPVVWVAQAVPVLVFVLMDMFETPVIPVTGVGVLYRVALAVPGVMVPCALLPQQSIVPVVSMAHIVVELAPVESDVIPLVSPVAGTGVVVFVVLPFPSWPEVPSPQHCTAPEVMAHAVEPPRVIVVTPVVSPVTGTGVVCEVVLVPLPRVPSVPFPQHSAAVEVMAQKVLFPPAIFVTPVSPVTVTGVREFVVVPFPSCPWVLSPQHWTVPPVMRAQAELPPMAMAVGVALSPVTVTGVGELTVVPFPSCPFVFSPQHCIVVPTRAHPEYPLLSNTICVAFAVMFVWVGVVWFAVPLFPVCPLSLFPQHVAVAFEFRIAQAVCGPPAICVTWVRPGTVIGVFEVTAGAGLPGPESLRVVPPPLPSSPK